MVKETLKHCSIASLDLSTQVLAVILASVVQGAVHMVVVRLQFVHPQHLLPAGRTQVSHVFRQAGHSTTLGMRCLQTQPEQSGHQYLDLLYHYCSTKDYN